MQKVLNTSLILNTGVRISNGAKVGGESDGCFPLLHRGK